jgi:hypothetical protein
MNNRHGLTSPTVLVKKSPAAAPTFNNRLPRSYFFWRSAVAVLLLASFLSRVTHAAESADGFLCCNAYSDGEEISDLNAPSAERHRVPVGSPIHVTKIGKHKVKLDVENRKQELSNDNSRALSMPEFVKRFVVPDDPSIKIKTFPTNVQVAIADGRLIHGMTREQVLMSLGYPTYDDVPNLSGKTWMYWITDHAQFRVTFGADDRVADVENVPDAKTQILMD